MAIQHQTKESTDILEDVVLDSPWRLILFNDDVHSFEEVIFQVMKATGYSQDKAENITIEAHQKGRAIVYEGDFEKCFKIDRVLKEIDLKTEIEG